MRRTIFEQQTEISPDLAKATFEALRPFIDVFDCGVKWNAEHVHMITKEKRRLMERYRWELKLGVERPKIYYESNPWRLFHPKHYFAGELRAKRIREMLEGTETYYYTSGRGKRALLYLDLDVHKEHQTLEDSREAVKAWDEILGNAGFHRPSRRGDNIFIKVSYSGHSVLKVNETFHRFETIAKRYMERRGLKADVEVKGTITTPEKSGSLAKLPIGNFQNSPWTWDLLEDFRSRPIIDLKVMIQFLDRLEAILDEKGKPVDTEECPRAARSARRTAESVGGADRLASVEEFCCFNDDVLGEKDARKRQHAVLCEYCRRMGRVVSVEEALEYIRANGFFTPPWENPSRARRVKDILDYIARTFDPEKCRGKSVEIKVGRHDHWALCHVQRVKTPARRGIDEYGRVYSVTPNIRVEPRFLSACLSAVEFCLVTEPNEDKSIPEKRLEAIWPTDYVKWNAKKWRVCRDALEKLGVIKVTDRNWHVGKAMRYETGEQFDELSRWGRRERRQSPFEAVPLEEFLGTPPTTPLHNSYKRESRREETSSGTTVLEMIRPPP